jgi:hypothetical protein
LTWKITKSVYISAISKHPDALPRHARQERSAGLKGTPMFRGFPGEQKHNAHRNFQYKNIRQRHMEINTAIMHTYAGKVLVAESRPFFSQQTPGTQRQRRSGDISIAVEASR